MHMVRQGAALRVIRKQVTGFPVGKDLTRLGGRTVTLAGKADN